MDTFPAELVALIVEKMDNSTRINYAATGSHSALDLLLLPNSCMGPISAEIADRLHDSLDTYPRSHDYIACLIESGGVGIDAKVALALSSLFKTLPREGALDFMIAQGRQEHVRRITISTSRNRTLTADLTNLLSIHILGGTSLAVDWLPKSISGNIKVLKASDSRLTFLPPGMTTLRELFMAECKSLADDWLPDSSNTPGLRIYY